MPFKDLRDYIKYLEKRGLIREVETEVDLNLEVAEIARRVILKQGPTLLFKNVKGYHGWRLLTNLYPSLDRIKEILDTPSLEDIGKRLTAFLMEPPPTGIIDKLEKLGEIVKFSNYMPKKSRSAKFLENVMDNASFSQLPIPKIWPKDGGKYITFGLVTLIDPIDRITNMGVYRIQIINEKKAAIHWQSHKRGNMTWMKAKDVGEKEVKVAIVIGSDPATTMTGVMPVPYPMDKLLFAGILRGEGINVFELESGILVPSNAELVIEGHVSTNELLDEGPYGDHLGYYTPVDKYPAFYIEKIYHRNEPIYHFTVTGKPIMEDGWLGKAVERIFLPIIKMIMPEVVDINLPPYGLFQGLGIVSIKKRYPGHGKKVMMGLWGLGQLSLTKILIVVDEDVNVHDINHVIYALATCVDPQRDVLVIPNTHTDDLDHTSQGKAYGSKLGIDATKKMKQENYGREWPEMVEPDERIVKLVNEKWKDYNID